MKMQIYMPAILLAFLLVSCGERKTNRLIFEENLEAYVASCVPPLTQKGVVDAATARSFCRCALEKAYAIDSTFFTKKDADIKAFINKYSQDLFDECRHLLIEQ